MISLSLHLRRLKKGCRLHKKLATCEVFTDMIHVHSVSSCSLGLDLSFHSSLKALMEHERGHASAAGKQNALQVNQHNHCYCSLCGWSFDHPDQLDRHRFAIHGLHSQLQCSHCKGPFPNPQLLLRHEAYCFANPYWGSQLKPIDVDYYAPKISTQQALENWDILPSTQSIMGNTGLSQPQAASWLETPDVKLTQSVPQMGNGGSDSKNLADNSHPDGASSSDIKAEFPDTRIYDDRMRIPRQDQLLEFHSVAAVVPLVHLQLLHRQRSV